MEVREIYKTVQCCDSIAVFTSHCENRSNLLSLYLHERRKIAFQMKADHSRTWYTTCFFAPPLGPPPYVCPYKSSTVTSATTTQLNCYVQHTVYVNRQVPGFAGFILQRLAQYWHAFFAPVTFTLIYELDWHPTNTYLQTKKWTF